MKIKSIRIEAEEWADWTPADDNTYAVVTLDDGSEWWANFYSYRNILSLTQQNQRTGELLDGKYFWAPDMILVDEVSRARIEEVITYLVTQKPLDFQSIFTRHEDVEEADEDNCE